MQSTGGEKFSVYMYYKTKIVTDDEVFSSSGSEDEGSAENESSDMEKKIDEEIKINEVVEKKQK